MRDRRRLAALLLATSLAGSLLTGCSDDAEGGDDLTATAVEPPFEVASTSLTDTDGEPFTLAEPGKPLSLLFFGYTHCPDICPATLGTIASALTRLGDEEREQVQLVFVTTDPATDTPPVVRRYLDGFDPTAVGLTGDLEEVVALAESVGVFVADAEELASGGYALGSHGAQVIAVEEDGEAPAFWRQDVSAAQLASDVSTLLQD